LDTGNFSLASGANFIMQLSGTSGAGTAETRYDELDVAGSVTLGGDAELLLLGYTPTVGATFYAILNSGGDPVTGSFFNAVNNIITSDGWEYTVNYASNGNGGSGGDDVSFTALAAVPEPSTTAALAIGFLMLAGYGGSRSRWRNCSRSIIVSPIPTAKKLPKTAKTMGFIGDSLDRMSRNHFDAKRS
jgi:hypothetical protein